MDYREAESYLQSLTDYEKSPSTLYNAANYDLRRMQLLLKALGNPQRGRRTIHIAGTKGKGSTAAMISSILTSSGYVTGRFTSPHLISWQERIAINNRPITRKDFARLAAMVKPHVQSINARAWFGKLTTFEALTAMAFCYFRERGVDVQVLEAGMGGRLDSTNVVEKPDICILTSISLDHTQILGDTTAQIASEKAGIIKPGCIAITAPQPPGAMAAIKSRCREVKAPLMIAGRDITWSFKRSSFHYQVFDLHSNRGVYCVNLPLLGDYQMENAALAVAAAEYMNESGLKIDRTRIARGLSGVKWPARLEVLGRSPLFIVDGAHNPYSIKILINSVNRHFIYNDACIIFGSSQDKDVKGMAKELARFAGYAILTSSSHPRAASADYLSSFFKDTGISVKTAPAVEKAVSMALEQAGENDLVLATGSLFLAAEVKELIGKSRKFV